MEKIDFIKKHIHLLMPLNYSKNGNTYHIKSKFDFYSLDKYEFIKILEFYAMKLNEVIYNEKQKV